MTAAAKGSTASRDLAADLIFLTRALKAPTLRDSAGRLAERAWAESWSHEEYLTACLQREVAPRDAHGGEGRIRTARFPARKSLEEFDFDYARGLKRDLIAHLGTLDFVAGKENVIFLGPPGTGKTHLAIGLGHPSLPSRAPCAVRHCQPMGRPARAPRRSRSPTRRLLPAQKPRPRPRPHRPGRHQLKPGLVKIQLPKLVDFQLPLTPLST
jgi:IstB-like ATP binding protein